MRAASWLVIVLSALVVFSAALAETNVSPLTLETISQISGDFYPAYHHQDYLYAPYDGALDIVNLQNSAYPQLANTLPGLSGYYIAFADDRAYLSTGGGVTIVDLSDPENPIPLNTYNDFEPWNGYGPYVGDLAAYGNTLFVTLNYSKRCTLHGKIAVLDVSDPLNPVRIGTQEYLSGVGEIEVVGDKLLALYWDVVDVYDVSVPGELTPVNSFSGPYLGHHDTARLQINGQYALINYYPVTTPCYTVWESAWHVVDVSLLPAVTFLQSADEELSLKTYEDGYLYGVSFNGLEFILEIRRYPDLTVATETFDEALYSIVIAGGYLQAPEAVDYLPAGLTTFRLSAVSETIDPVVSTTLIYTDTLGVTSFELPAGSVLSPTVVSVLPLPKVDYPPPGRFQRHAFDIRGHLPAEQLTLEAFQQPISATLPLPADPAVYPLGYEFLYWDGEQWVDAATTCGVVSSFPETLEFPGNSVGDNLIVSFCKPGKYALFVPLYDAFLPAVFR